jgi:hypothetical protein
VFQCESPAGWAWENDACTGQLVELHQAESFNSGLEFGLQIHANR